MFSDGIEDRFALDFATGNGRTAIGQSCTSNVSANMDERDKSMIKELLRVA